jgi:hypothetical protein
VLDPYFYGTRCNNPLIFEAISAAWLSPSYQPGVIRRSGHTGESVA